MNYLIEVTADDIEESEDDNETPAARCPLARALCRALGYDLDAHRVLICANDPDEGQDDDGERPLVAVVDSAEYPLPFEARQFAAHFDSGMGMEPLAFAWDGPPPETSLQLAFAWAGPLPETT